MNIGNPSIGGGCVSVSTKHRTPFLPQSSSNALTLHLIACMKLNRDCHEKVHTHEIGTIVVVHAIKKLICKNAGWLPHSELVYDTRGAKPYNFANNAVQQ